MKCQRSARRGPPGPTHTPKSRRYRRTGRIPTRPKHRPHKPPVVAFRARKNPVFWPEPRSTSKRSPFSMNSGDSGICPAMAPSWASRLSRARDSVSDPLENKGRRQYGLEPCDNRLPKMFHARGQNLDAKPLAVFVDDTPERKSPSELMRRNAVVLTSSKSPLRKSMARLMRRFKSLTVNKALPMESILTLMAEAGYNTRSRVFHRSSTRPCKGRRARPDRDDLHDCTGKNPGMSGANGFFPAFF